MATIPTTFNDWLSASSVPIHDGLYFLGACNRRITFYSQQVRALRLVHALSSTGKLKTTHNVAVVGAGAAGVTAALGLALLGNDVTLYDPADEVLQLQSDSPRLLHPHIYEWPALDSLNNRAGLPILDWTAERGGDVCKQLQKEFSSALTSLSTLRFAKGHTLTGLTKTGTRWKLTLETGGAESSKQFDHVVLALGFGDENSCGDAVPVHYWKQNLVGSAAVEPKSPATYVISGNGDGGLTDLLNLLIKNFDHVAFTQDFLNFFSDDILLRTTKQIWENSKANDDLEPAFTEHLLPLLNELDVIDRIRLRLRSDRLVTINSSGPLFAAHKAAQLNQVMAFAILHAAAKGAYPVVRSEGYINNVTNGTNGFHIDGLSINGVPVATPVQHVILRHGPNRDMRYASAKDYFNDYRNHAKILFANNLNLEAPPTLDSTTFEFFESLRINKLLPKASQPAAIISLDETKGKLIIGLDPAVHVAVEFGSDRLINIAAQCERLTRNITLQFTAAPKAIPDVVDIIRIVKASGGRISMFCLPEHFADWKILAPNVAPIKASVTHYPAVALDVFGLREAADDCLLRLLDDFLNHALQNNSCHNIPLNVSIATAIGPTWASWKTALINNKALLSAFLRWLANVETNDNMRWNGDHAAVPDLAVALVMMLATHHGEHLVPALLDRGNLQLKNNAVAIGSGCRNVGNQLIDVWDQPDQWGVDALILSGSAEVDVIDPPGRILDGGKPIPGMMTARRVRPAIIRNDKKWRERLKNGLNQWTEAVQAEFGALRERQDKEFKDLIK